MKNPYAGVSPVAAIAAAASRACSVGAEGGGLLVVAVRLSGDVGRLRKTRKVGIRANASGGVGRTGRDLAQALVARAVRDGDADAAVPHGAHGHDGVVDERRLVLRRPREPRQA